MLSCIENRLFLTGVCVCVVCVFMCVFVCPLYMGLYFHLFTSFPPPLHHGVRVWFAGAHKALHGSSQWQEHVLCPQLEEFAKLMCVWGCLIYTRTESSCQLSLRVGIVCESESVCVPICVSVCVCVLKPLYESHKTRWHTQHKGLRPVQNIVSVNAWSLALFITFIKTSAHPAYAESPQHQLEQYHTDPGECIHSFTEDLPQEKWKSQNHSDIGNPESALTQYCVNRIYQKLSNTHTHTHTIILT